jgi:hypothetical protein
MHRIAKPYVNAVGLMTQSAAPKAMAGFVVVAVAQRLVRL